MRNCNRPLLSNLKTRFILTVILNTNEKYLLKFEELLNKTKLHLISKEYEID